MIKTIILGTLLFFVSLLSLRAENDRETQDLLKKLDSVLDNQPVYFKKKMDKIDSLKENLQKDLSSEELLHCYKDLYTEYIKFNIDSAQYYAIRIKDLAKDLNKLYRYNKAQLCIAGIYTAKGLYSDAINTLNQIDTINSKHIDMGDYYNRWLFLSRDLAKYDYSRENQQKYEYKSRFFLEKILSATPPGRDLHITTRVELLLNQENSAEAKDYFESYYSKPQNKDPRAGLSYRFAQIYEKMQDTINWKKYLIIASIKDLEIENREYISLYDLAQLLYSQGDIERANRYIQRTMTDAVNCNFNTRILQTSNSMSFINQAFIAESKQKESLLRSKLFITIFSLFIILLISIYVFYQKEKIKKASLEKIRMNNELISINEQLKQSNESFRKLNKELSDTSYIKDEYVIHYMDLCTSYIEKMDTYRRNLNKVANSDGMDKLLKELRSPHQIEAEYKEFYRHFDETFLAIFPNFIQEVNALLNENNQFRQSSRLNTELRILAAIRLGITDSVKIAHFLHCAVSTIYTYRTKLRNGATGNREEFEDRVININIC